MHLRVGDVLDWDFYRLRAHCASAGGCHYARPIDSYRDLNVPRALTHIVIVGNPAYRHLPQYGHAHSTRYMHAVEQVFQDRGYRVHQRSGHSADDDLLYMTHACYLNPGLGGFAMLSERCASKDTTLVPTRPQHPRRSPGSDAKSKSVVAISAGAVSASTGSVPNSA